MTFIGEAPALVGLSAGQVVVLPPLAPETQAYALARYSRSPDAISDSLRWVHEHSAERFLDKFYFEYGHASIADLGHVAVCLEGVSELAAAEVLHESLMDAQQKSTRYQDFSNVPLMFPVDLDRGADSRARAEVEDLFSRAMAALLSAYREVHAAELAALMRQHPRPDGMDPGRYERTLAARAFDVARYLLPVATTTNLGVVMSIRTLERTIGRLSVSSYVEVRLLAERLAQACQAPVDATWAKVSGSAIDARPLVPTLARHVHPHAYAAGVRERARTALAGLPSSDSFAHGWRESAGAAGQVELVSAMDLETEILATLLYRDARLPYRQMVDSVGAMTGLQRHELLAGILGDIGPHDEPPRELRSGYRFAFDVEMDWGGFRDLHRHRRCEQVVQRFDLDAGLQLPPVVASPGTTPRIEAAHEAAVASACQVAALAGEDAAVYLLPFAHRVRVLFKMDFAELQYLTRLRSGKKGHDSYRAIAWAMAEAARKAEPGLAGLIQATSPDERDPLIR